MGQLQHATQNVSLGPLLRASNVGIFTVLINFMENAATHW
jgi:hypothetical protein